MRTIVEDFSADALGSLFISVGVFNFAVASGFPVAGISGIAVIFHHFFHVPIGIMTIILNIPIILVCYRLLGKSFFLKSLRTMLIYTIMMDFVAPLFPIYRGDLILSSVCMGVFAGIGFGLIYTRDTSTGGTDFIIMALRKKKPYISLGKLIVTFDFTVVIVGGILMNGDMSSIIYGLIASFILSVVVDKFMYGMDEGKVAMIVTDMGQEVSNKIAELTGRGSTLIKSMGSYSKEEKHVVMCACNKKQMHMVQNAVKEVDYQAFMVIMESSEVRGHGFKPH